MKEGTRYNRGDDEGASSRGRQERGQLSGSPRFVIRDSRVRQRRASQKLPSTITKSLLDRPLPHAQDMGAPETAWSACGFHSAALGRYWASLAAACMRVRLRSLDTAARLQREPRKWLHFQAFLLKESVRPGSEEPHPSGPGSGSRPLGKATKDPRLGIGRRNKPFPPHTGAE